MKNVFTHFSRVKQANWTAIYMQKQHHLHNTTIAWLERCQDQPGEDDDTGEDTSSDQPGRPPHGDRGRMMKENSAEYELWDDSIE